MGKKGTYLFGLILYVLSFTLPCHSEIPFEQALGMYEGTKEELKPYSPFWGMVALHSRMLEWIRFFGNYQSKEDSDGNKSDEGQDIIAILIKRFFNSPDGVQFVATTYQNDPVGNLSRNLGKINDIIEVLLTKQVDSKLSPEEIRNKSALNKQRTQVLSEIKKINSGNYKGGETLENLQTQGENLKIQIEAIKPKVSSKSDQIETILNSMESEDPKILAKNKELADIIVSAYNKQQNYTRAGNPDSYLYPENSVITILLAFYAKVADNKTQMKKDLPFLLRDDFDDQCKFTQEDYSEHLRKGDENVEYMNAIIHNRDHPELAFLLGKGFEGYENVFVSPLTYRSDTCYVTGQPYPDCGETSLRNVLTLFLSASQAGIVKPEAIHAFKEKLSDLNPGLNLEKHEPFRRMIAFLEEFPSLYEAATRDAHSRWAQVVSNLNNGQPLKSLNDVQYGRNVREEDPETYEIKAGYHPQVRGIINMLNVIAKLIPDEVLNETWDADPKIRKDQVDSKLDRLCELFSRKSLDLSWSFKQRTLANAFEYATITFEANQNPAFEWIFQPYHFQLTLTPNTIIDWRPTYEEDDGFANEWMASLFRQHYKLATPGEIKKPLAFPLSLIYRRGLRDIIGIKNVIQFVIHNDLKAFDPLIKRWVEMTFYTNDIHGLKEFSTLFYKIFFTIPKINLKADQHDAIVATIKNYRDSLDKRYKLPSPYLHALDGFIIDKIIAEDQLDLFKTLMENHIFTLHTKSITGYEPLQIACSHLKKDFIQYILDQGVDPSKPDRGAEPALNLLMTSIINETNFKIGNEQRLSARQFYIREAVSKLKPYYDLLISAGGKDMINMGNKNGCTPACITIRYETTLPLLRSLVNDYGANIEHKNHEGCTLLCQAIKEKNFGMIKALVEEFNGDVNATDIHGYTPLHWILHHSSHKSRIGISDWELTQMPKMIELLVNHGAYVDKKDANGQTPLDYLNYDYASTSFVATVREILEKGQKSEIPSSESQPTQSQ